MNIDPGAVAPFLAFYQFYGPESLCLVPHPLFPSSLVPVFRYPITYSLLPTSPPNQLDFKAASQIWRADKLDFKLMLGCSQLSTPYPLIPVFIFTIVFPYPIPSVRFPLPARLRSSVYDPAGGQARLHTHARLLLTTLPLLAYSLSPFFLPAQLDFKAAFTIWCVDKLDFMVMLGCFLGIIFGSPEIGLLVASVLSVLKLLLRIVCPHIRLLGLLSLLLGGAATAVSVLQFPNRTLCEGIVMLRIESPLYFPAANFCRQHIKKLEFTVIFVGLSPLTLSSSFASGSAAFWT
ncbi:unnamed protein product [Closterium sp. NIES-54]